MRPGPAAAIVFGSSAAVLVVEITAGRLMAPYVGVSLETFTGIIGVVLAGIATGAAVGGRQADRRPPERLLGPVLVVGGALVWLSVPVVQVAGPHFGPDPISIVVLTTVSFFAPAAVLSAATPIVAKLRLRSLDRTGSVFGGLSAAGTIGGLAGTFLTGFVLVALIGSRSTMFAVGAGLVAAGAVIHWKLVRQAPTATAAALLLIAGLTVYGFEPVCDVETKYSCAEIEVDRRDPSRRDLILDTVRHAAVDVDDPTWLDLRYIRLFADVADALPPGPVDAVHIGGGGFTLPRYVAATRAGSTNIVLEIDPGVVDVARGELGLADDDGIDVIVGDARPALGDLATDSADLVVGDAFSGRSMPWHLTTVEVADEIARILRPGGIYVVNVIDGAPNDFARAELATLQERFDHVAVILADGRPSRRPRNQILVASDRPIPAIDAAEGDGILLVGDAVDDYIGDATVLTDDFAPVDQLVTK